jgi:L-ascorbate metabolism protein UlaG (beta-lactamase superfamily)
MTAPLDSANPLNRRQLLAGATAAALALPLLPEAQAAPVKEKVKPNELKIAWYGQSMFMIVTPKATKILIDPQDIEAHKVPYVTGDLLLFSHFHTDHTTTVKVENIKEIKQFNAMKKIGPGGLDTEWEAVDETFKDVSIQSIATYHDESRGTRRGKNGGWLITIDGVRIAHLGDLGHTLNAGQLKKIGKVDVLMVPCGGIYTINGIDAFKVAQQIKPTQYVIPMHYGTIVYDELLPLKWFTDEVKEDGMPIITLKPKEWLSLDVKNPVKKPSVAVLSYIGPGGSELPTMKKD